MKSKSGNSRFYFANKNRILPKSKRSQSEIITTVLIILLVLAAIVIVWQVVQGTIGAGAKAINQKKDCLGLDVVIMKAIASKGSCAYTEPAAAGVQCETVAGGGVVPSPATGILIGTACPLPTVKTGGSCDATWSEPTPTGSILIRREGTSTAKGIKTQLLINDKINQSHNAAGDKALDITYDTDTYLVGGLTVGAEVQITPLLTDNTACGLTQKYQVTSG